MTNSRAKKLTMFLKSYDKNLYALAEYDSTKVYKKAYRFSWYDLDGSTIGYAHEYGSYICALTTNWNLTGTPVDWSFDQVLERIKSIDLQNEFNESKKVIENLENDYEVRARHMHNLHEDIAREVRPVFKKAFADVNTASMEKIDKRRIQDGRRK